MAASSASSAICKVTTSKFTAELNCTCIARDIFSNSFAPHACRTPGGGRQLPIPPTLVTPLSGTGSAKRRPFVYSYVADDARRALLKRAKKFLTNGRRRRGLRRRPIEGGGRPQSTAVGRSTDASRPGPAVLPRPSGPRPPWRSTSRRPAVNGRRRRRRRGPSGKRAPAITQRN